jgi:hypothetical protein
LISKRIQQLFYADPDPGSHPCGSREPSMRIHADPDPGQTLKLQEVQNLNEKSRYQYIGQITYHTYEGTEAFFNGRKPGLFVNFSKFPDPHSQYGSGSRTAKSMRIRIRQLTHNGEAGNALLIRIRSPNTDPDPGQSNQSGSGSDNLPTTEKLETPS